MKVWVHEYYQSGLNMISTVSFQNFMEHANSSGKISLRFIVKLLNAQEGEKFKSAIAKFVHLMQK